MQKCPDLLILWAIWNFENKCHHKIAAKVWVGSVNHKCLPGAKGEGGLQPATKRRDSKLSPAIMFLYE